MNEISSAETQNISEDTELYGQHSIYIIILTNANNDDDADMDKDPQTRYVIILVVTCFPSHCMNRRVDSR